MKSNYERVKKWRKKNPEKRKAQSKRYYNKYKDKINQKSVQWQRSNRERYRKNQRDWYNKNKERLRKKHAMHERERRKRNIVIALEIYGAECLMCGESNIILFEWHHRNQQNRKGSWERGDQVAARIKKLGKQDSDIQLLCANCHILANIRDSTNIAGKLLKEIQDEGLVFKN